jgi:hypothetical protein
LTVIIIRLSGSKSSRLFRSALIAMIFALTSTRSALIVFRIGGELGSLDWLVTAMGGGQTGKKVESKGLIELVFFMAAP